MSKINISFDFDGTLGHREDVQEFCKRCLLDSNIEVFITTRRYGESTKCLKNQPDCEFWTEIGDKNWTEVYDLADKFGISRKNIYFCNMKPKSDYFNTVGNIIEYHLDDDNLEVDEINLCTSVIAINIKRDNWRDIIEPIILH